MPTTGESYVRARLLKERDDAFQRLIGRGGGEPDLVHDVVGPGPQQADKLGATALNTAEHNVHNKPPGDPPYWTASLHDERTAPSDFPSVRELIRAVLAAEASSLA
jgi:hypothetical protein